jgi:hypothetical protein
MQLVAFEARYLLYRTLELLIFCGPYSTFLVSQHILATLRIHLRRSSPTKGKLSNQLTKLY